MEQEPDEDIIRHMIDNQIEPQVIGAQHGIKTPLVYTGKDGLPGHVQITCSGCRRTAWLPEDELPPDELARAVGGEMTCPACLRKKVGG